MRRDLPTPGSPTSATNLPWPRSASSVASRSSASSISRPTNRVRPRTAARCRRERMWPVPVSSKIAIGLGTRLMCDGPCEAMHRLHHPGKDGIENASRLLRVTVGQKLERSAEVGQEYGHLLALAFQRFARASDPFGQILRRVVLRRSEALERRIENG